MLSIVIPILNAGETLSRCLSAIELVDEIVIVDGGSHDDSIAIASQAGARLIEAPANRGGQLRAGAEAASGDWLLFLHADTILAPDWRAAVAAHIAVHPHCAACFGFRLDDGAWQARLIEAGVAFRTRALGLPYGDQGLLISRTLYDQLGGFRALALMEDVDMIRRVGLQRLRILPTIALTSAERWRRDGWWRRSVRNLTCLLAYSLGAPPERIVGLYR